jgi:hypothetical protein
MRFTVAETMEEAAQQVVSQLKQPASQSASR